MRGLAVIVFGLALAWAAPALAGQPVALRPQPVASGPITLGDLFDNAGQASIVVVGTPAPVGLSAVLDAAVVQQIAKSHGLDWDNPAGMVRIIVPTASTAAAAQGGPVGALVDALTYTHNVNAGDIIQPTDVAYARVAKFSLPGDAPNDASGVIGKTARRPLRAGSAVAAHDLSNPILIKRDDVVQVTYHVDAITLILQGKAMGDAAAGEPVAIQNTNSKKVIQAVASGVGQAVVGPEADALRTQSRAPQFAVLP